MPQSDFWPFGRTKPVAEVDFSGQSILRKQLVDIEGEVKKMQMELAAIRRNVAQDFGKEPIAAEDMGDNAIDSGAFDRYKCFEEQFTTEESEISKLRAELTRAKKSAEEERIQRLKYEGQLRDLELKLNDICSAGKAVELKERKSTDDEVASFKSQIRDLKEQIEEMKSIDDEKTEQLEDYRAKYLQAQQQVEEFKRQGDIVELENKQTSDEIQMELHKMKIQFQEKLLELAPLPELVKSAHIQLQEANQLQKIAEDNAAQVSNELLQVKEKLAMAVSRYNQEKNEKNKLIDEISAYKVDSEEKQNKIDELLKEIDEYKCKVVRLDEKLSQLQVRYDEVAVKYIQLYKDLEELKEDSNRSLLRTKDRAGSTKHFLQTQIASLERQMVTCRAQCRMYQKERDQVRQRMQLQVHSLKENFELVESRMRDLQGQVALLKHCCSISIPDDVVVNQEQNYNNYGQL